MNNPEKKLLAAAGIFLLLCAGYRSTTEAGAGLSAGIAAPPEREETGETFPEEVPEAPAPEKTDDDWELPPAASVPAVRFRTPLRLAPGDSVSAEAAVLNSGAEAFHGAAEWEIFHDGNLIDRFGVMLEAAPGDEVFIPIPIQGAGSGVLTLNLVLLDSRGVFRGAGSTEILCREAEFPLPPPADATVTQSVFMLPDAPEAPEIPAGNLAEVPFGCELEVVYTIDGAGKPLPPGRLETGDFPGGSPYSSEFSGGSVSVVVTRRVIPAFPGRYRLPEAVVIFSDGTGVSSPGIMLNISGPAY